MILQELLERNNDQLTRTDRKLASVLLAHPRDSVFLSTNEIAERAAVHPASAVRLARKLGFAGYPALRSALQMELFNETAAAERVRRRIEHLGQGEVLRAFVQSEIRALSLLPERVDDKRIIAAARAVVRARTVFLFGTGHAETLVRLLEIRLARGGYDAMVLAADAREAAAALQRARRGDAFILFAFYSIPSRMQRILACAREIQATTIIITDIVNPVQLPRADVILAATRGETGEARSLVVPMTICNTIILQVSRLDRGRMIRNLEKLEAIRTQLGPAS